MAEFHEDERIPKAGENLMNEFDAADDSIIEGVLPKDETNGVKDILSSNELSSLKRVSFKERKDMIDNNLHPDAIEMFPSSSQDP